MEDSDLLFAWIMKEVVFVKHRTKFLAQLPCLFIVFIMTLGHSHFLIVLQESRFRVKFSELLANYINQLFLVQISSSFNFLSFFEDLGVARTLTNHASSWTP